MSDGGKPVNSFGIASFGVACGVFWFIWGKYGFWWGLLYGAFWHEWMGYRLAQYLVTP